MLTKVVQRLAWPSRSPRSQQLEGMLMAGGGGPGHPPVSCCTVPRSLRVQAW